MSQTSGLDDIGHLLHALTLATGATRVLEIGTGSAASTLCMASALPDGGLLITLERDRATAERARAQVSAAGLDGRVSVMVGDAARFLHKIGGPFDVIFDDGDPAGRDAVHDRLVGLLRPHGVLVRRAGPVSGDDRLFTVALAGGGAILSVRRQ